jgi:hypothetical protein
MPLRPEGALATAKTHEANYEWPTLIEIVAYFGPYGAPMSGSRLITMVERLRRPEGAR